MGATLSYMTQREVRNTDNPKARYISDSRIQIDSRMGDGSHSRSIVPCRKNVARRVSYWHRRYHGVDILMCRRDMRGAFKPLMASISGPPTWVVGVPGISLRRCRYTSAERPLRRIDATAVLLLQFAASFRPVEAHLHGAESFPPSHHIDDGAVVET